MTTIGEAQEGVHCVCGAHELEQKTKQGWKLVEIVREVGEHVTEREPAPPPDPSHPNYHAYNNNYGPYPGTIECHRWKPTECVSFLLKLEPSEHVAELTASIQSLTDKLSEATKKNGELTEAAKKLTIERDEAVSRMDNHRRRADAADGRVADQRKTMVAYETDMAKIREAVGSLRLNEILGKSEKSEK